MSYVCVLQIWYASYVSACISYLSVSHHTCHVSVFYTVHIVYVCVIHSVYRMCLYYTYAYWIHPHYTYYSLYVCVLHILYISYVSDYMQYVSVSHYTRHVSVTHTHIVRRGGGLGSRPIFKNLMSPTPRRKWYLTTGCRAHWMVLDPIPQSLSVSPPPLTYRCSKSSEWMCQVIYEGVTAHTWRRHTRECILSHINALHYTYDCIRSHPWSIKL